jgi:tetratricopeptide (TPR) repeat protein
MPIDFQPPPPATKHLQPAANASFDEQYEQARALANSGQPALAVAAYNALLTRSPGNVDVLLGRGIAYTRLDRWAEAQADLEAAAKASPDYADVWLALGNLHQWHDQPEPAIAAYSRLVALRPNDPASWLARARAYRAAGKLAEARADLAQARTAGGNAAEIDVVAGALARAGGVLVEGIDRHARGVGQHAVDFLEGLGGCGAARQGKRGGQGRRYGIHRFHDWLPMKTGGGPV